MSTMLNFDVPDLYVKDSHDDFKQRQGSLFSALEAAEKEHSEILPKVKNKPDKPLPKYSQKYLFKPYRGKESIFKTPETPLSRLKNRNYGKPQGRWTRYTLNDVSVDDMSDSSNSRAAFSFLRELQDRRHAAERQEIPADFKPVFQRPQVKKEEESVPRNKKEYNFGEKPEKFNKKKKKIVATNDDSTSHVKLNHLVFEEEDD